MEKRFLERVFLFLSIPFLRQVFCVARKNSRASSFVCTKKEKFPYESVFSVRDKHFLDEPFRHTKSTEGYLSLENEKRFLWASFSFLAKMKTQFFLLLLNVFPFSSLKHGKAMELLLKRTFSLAFFFTHLVFINFLDMFKGGSLRES